MPPRAIDLSDETIQRSYDWANFFSMSPDKVRAWALRWALDRMQVEDFPWEWMEMVDEDKLEAARQRTVVKAEAAY